MTVSSPLLRPGRSLPWELAVNFAGTGWSAVVQLACIPVYLALLGPERYALIAFATMLLIALKSLDFGVSHTINRELAGRLASGRTDGARELLRTLEVAYSLIGLALGGALVLVAPLIATRWIGANTMGTAQVTEAVRLIGLLVMVQWPLTFYQGALLGLGRSTSMNAAAIAASTLSGGGAVLLLIVGHRSLNAMLLWQCSIAALHTLVLAVASHRALPHNARPARVTGEILSDLRRTMTGVGLLALTLLLLLQGDKVLASRWLPLASYGYYMLATTVANGLGVLSAPVFNTFLPRLAALAAMHDEIRLEADFRRGTRLLTVFVFPAMITIGVLAGDVLRGWTRDATAAHLASRTTMLLLAGTGCATLLQLAMILQMSTGRTALGVRVHALLALALIPAAFLGATYGAIGVAAAWVALVAVGALAGGAMIYRDQLGHGARRWLLTDVGRPLASMLGTALLAWPVLSLPLDGLLAAIRLVALGLLLSVVASLAAGMRLTSLPGILASAGEH